MSALDSKLRSQLDTVCQKAPRGLKRRRGPPCRSGPSIRPNRTRISRPPSSCANRLRARGRQAGDVRRADRPQAIDAVFSARSTPLPVVAAKGSFGN